MYLNVWLSFRELYICDEIILKKKDEGVVKILPAVVCVFSLADRDFIWTSPLVGFCHMLGESVAYYHMQF